MRNGQFGSTTVAIVLDDVQCTGTEEGLLNCSNSGVGVHDCTHAEDAGVICNGTYVYCSGTSLLWTLWVQLSLSLIERFLLFRGARCIGTI